MEKASFSDSDLRALEPKEKKYREPTGNGLFVDVYPGGGRYFIWRYRFPPGRNGQQRDYQIGPYGKGPGQWTLKAAREERDRLEVLRGQGEDPRALKAERRLTVQQVGAVSFQKKAADAWFANVSTKLAATTPRDYKNKLENEILPEFGKRSVKTIPRAECLDFKQKIVARGSLNQLDKVFGVLRQIFSYAIDQEWAAEPIPARSSRHSHS